MATPGFTPRPLFAMGRTVHRDAAGFASLGTIAECRVRKIEPVVTKAEAEANARLYAASPKLYALAEHVLAMADDAYLTGHPEWAALVEEAKAAHAAAGRGR